MKKIYIVFILLVMSLSFGCSNWDAQRMAHQQMKYNHEEKMAQIKAQNGGMSEKDKAQLADMIADRVVERLNKEQK
jgi:hypothetical protein